jgi:apolipoprotein N-acyltransferase
MKPLLAIFAGGLLSGVLLAMALPPCDQWWLGPICLAPVLSLVAGKGLLRGFLGGMAVSIALVATILTGFIYGRTDSGSESAWIYTGCGFFGFLITTVCCVASETGTEGRRRVAVLSSLAVCLELAMFPVLPAHLALTQYRMGGMLLLASLGGIWLVSILIWAANVALADILRRSSSAPALTVFGALIAAYASGFLPRAGDGPTVRVGAVQTSEFDQELMRKLNAEAGKQGAVLTVWPEFSGLDMVRRGNSAELRVFSAEAGQPAFVTTFPDGFAPLPHNTAALFKHGRESDHYFKRKLFGGETAMHAPGDKAVAVPWRGKTNIGLNICFDSCYPQLIHDTSSLPNVGLIALPTIDPESAHGFVAAVHASFTPFRGAESGVPIVRGDGGAWSMIVDNTGRIVAQLGVGPGTVVGDVVPKRRWTLYSVLGDWALYLCLGYQILSMGLFLRRKLGSKPAKP